MFLHKIKSAVTEVKAHSKHALRKGLAYDHFTRGLCTTTQGRSPGLGIIAWKSLPENFSGYTDLVKTDFSSLPRYGDEFARESDPLPFSPNSANARPTPYVQLFDLH